MFGVEPDLLCEACADGVRRRMQVRFRPVLKDRKPIVTNAAIGIAAVLFIADKFVFKTGDWPGWWEALYLNLHAGPRIWDGHVWTLLGAAFFHGGFIHIFFNCWWILVLGRATESGFGHRTLIALIVGSAMVASGLEWIVNGPGVGLSGVVYALAFFLWAHHKSNPYAAAIMNRRTINFLSMWFVLCIVLTQTGTWNIANWAHGGGALWGWGVGLAMLHEKRKVLVPLAAAATVAIILATSVVTVGTQTDLRAADARQKAAGSDQRSRYMNYMSRRWQIERTKR